MYRNDSRFYCDIYRKPFFVLSLPPPMTALAYKLPRSLGVFFISRDTHGWRQKGSHENKNMENMGRCQYSLLLLLLFSTKKMNIFSRFSLSFSPSPLGASILLLNVKRVFCWARSFFFWFDYLNLVCDLLFFRNLSFHFFLFDFHPCVARKRNLNRQKPPIASFFRYIYFNGFCMRDLRLPLCMY